LSRFPIYHLVSFLTQPRTPSHPLPRTPRPPPAAILCRVGSATAGWICGSSTPSRAPAGRGARGPVRRRVPHREQGCAGLHRAELLPRRQRVEQRAEMEEPARAQGGGAVTALPPLRPLPLTLLAADATFPTFLHLSDPATAATRRTGSILQDEARQRHAENNKTRGRKARGEATRTRPDSDPRSPDSRFRIKQQWHQTHGLKSTLKHPG
ncbi:unnamed protein product, partial [Urochloa humidicola]